MNKHLLTSQPPERRLSKSQREASRLLEGFGTNKAKPFESLNRQDLLELRDKTHSMLNNTTIIATLPDKGSKLKEKLALIDKLLNSPDDNTPDSVTDKVSKLSLESNNRPNIRKKSVADANLEAARINKSSNLLQAHSPISGIITSGDSTSGDSVSRVAENDDRQKAKVRMISLEESVRLQNHQRDSIKEEGFKRQLRRLRSKDRHDLEDDISMTMNQLQLGPGMRASRPADDNTDDDEGPDEDDDDDDDDDDETYKYDSAYEEDDDSIHDEDYVQDDYYDRR